MKPKLPAPQIFAFAALALAACGSPNPPASPGAGDATPPSLAGHYRSDCVKTGDAQSITLDFSLADADWKLDYASYGDATCSAKMLTVHVEGPYQVTGKSGSVPGAWDARFAFSKKTITPHLDGAVAFLTSPQACGGGSFTVGKETDVLTTGCAGLGQYPLSRCGADFDVVALEGDALRFGDRPKDNDMCTEAKRPKALSQVASRRVK